MSKDEHTFTIAAKLQGAHLKKRRKELGLTQTGLAELLGPVTGKVSLDTGTIFRWEKNGFSNENIRIYHKVLDVDEDYFFIEENVETINDESLPLIEQSEKSDIITQFTKLTLEARNNKHTQTQKVIDLANIEKNSTSTFFDITRIFEKTLNFVAPTAGLNHQILFYSFNTESFFTRFTMKTTIESMLTCGGEYKISAPIVIGMRNELDNDLEEDNCLDDPAYLKKWLLGEVSGPPKKPQGKQWIPEFNYLQDQFETEVEPLLEAEEAEHLSVFALAPQPLLVKLGYLLARFKNVNMYQPHSESLKWAWDDIGEKTDFLVKEPGPDRGALVFNLSLSTTIDNSNIEKVLGKNLSICTFTIDEPNNNFLKTLDQLTDFKEIFKDTLEDILIKYRKSTVLHLFLSTPIAIAFEIGRVWYTIQGLELKLYGLNGETNDYMLLHTFPKR